ncbi:MAG: RNA polymerase sigma factor RpoD/SigA [Candidatus Aminicenantia bacterium]
MSKNYEDILTSDNLKLYLKEISKIPQLSEEEEKELARRIQKGDNEALKKIIEANLRFVVHYTKKYRGLGLSYLDLINQGNVGLIEAARRYDPSKNVKFISYAVWWIRQAIIQVLSDYARAYALPQKVTSLQSQIKKVESRLKMKLNREPLREEIAEEMNKSIEEIDDIYEIGSEDLSLNMPSFEESGELGDKLSDDGTPSVEYQTIKLFIKKQIRDILNELDEREALILRLRFGINDDRPKTLQEIGSMLNISRERVRQIEKRAKQKLARLKKVQQLRGYLN